MVDISIRGDLWDDDSADVLRWWGFRDITAPMDIRAALEAAGINDILADYQAQVDAWVEQYK